MPPVEPAADKIQNALEFLELWPLYVDPAELPELVKKQYYILAMQYHPDRRGDTETFQTLQRHYDYLINLIKQDSEHFIQLIRHQLCSGTEPAREDEIYFLYRQASRHYSEALESYFKHSNQVNLDAGDANYQRLRRALEAIKAQFARVLELDPGGMWAADAIEKISRINIWLKE